MKKQNLISRIGGAALGITFLLGIGMVSMTTAQAQWNQNQRGRDYGRDRNDRNRGGGYGYGYRVAQERGYQDGLQTGSNDSSRRQSYDPQRSHFFKDATYGYDRSYGNREAYKQTYRDAFVRGYNEGFRRYGGNGRGRGGGNGRWFPW
jgi:hypothetical protein